MSDVALPELTEDRLLHADVFRDIVRKDLLYNVYKDGIWGSYRHLPFDTGKYKPSHEKTCLRGFGPG